MDAVSGRALGPVVWNGPDGPVALPPKQRLLFGILCVDSGTTIPTASLVSSMWGDAPPPSATASLHAHVSKLRRAIGSVVERGSGGYRLGLDPLATDVGRFAALVRDARRLQAAGDRPAAAESLAAALDQWSGEPLADVEVSDSVRAVQVRLAEQRWCARQVFFDLSLETGRDADLVPTLEQAAAEDPNREWVWAQLMTALYRSGRQADALNAFQRARRHLVEEVGLEPGPELVRLERAVLAHDSRLLRSARSCTANVRRARCRSSVGMRLSM